VLTFTAAIIIITYSLVVLWNCFAKVNVELEVHDEQIPIIFWKNFEDSLLQPQFFIFN
jgi:hypothetical protein